MGVNWRGALKREGRLFKNSKFSLAKKNKTFQIWLHLKEIVSYVSCLYLIYLTVMSKELKRKFTITPVLLCFSKNCTPDEKIVNYFLIYAHFKRSEGGGTFIREGR